MVERRRVDLYNAALQGFNAAADLTDTALSVIDADSNSQFRQQQDARLSATYAAVVTAQAKGAAADGATDDTAALQAAVNAAATSGLPVEIRGRIRITSPIVLPAAANLTIRAGKRDRNAFGVLGENVASIETAAGCISVFAATNSAAVLLAVEGINFRNTDGSITTSVFNTVTLADAHITDCTANGFNYIFKGGEVGGTSRIHHNRFVGIKTAFCSANVVDTNITDNYINGSPESNASVFTGGWATSLFANNYVDFVKRVFDCPVGTMADVRVHGNIFDYVWCTIGTSTGAFLTSFTVTGNTWFHCTAAEANPFFTAEDADMTGTPWRAIDASAGINRSTISGNHFMGVTEAIRLRGGVNHIKESGNIYDDTDPTKRVDFGGDWPNEGVQLDVLDKGRQTPTFANPLPVNLKSAALVTVNMTGNLSGLTLANPIHDQVYEIAFVQDGTGSRTLSGATAKIKWAGAAPTLSTGAGKRDVFRFRYHATNDAFYEISRSMNVG